MKLKDASRAGAPTSITVGRQTAAAPEFTVAADDDKADATRASMGDRTTRRAGRRQSSFSHGCDGQGTGAAG